MIKGEILLICAIIAALTLLLVIAQDDTLEQAQAGVITLQCHMKDGERVIDPDKVVDLVEGTWVFTSGSAKNCSIIKGGGL